MEEACATQTFTHAQTQVEKFSPPQRIASWSHPHVNGKISHVNIALYSITPQWITTAQDSEFFLSSYMLTLGTVSLKIYFAMFVHLLRSDFISNISSKQ